MRTGSWKSPKPGPEHVGSWKVAETNAARWMRHWGYSDAKANPGGADGGIDVRATGAFAQVKNRTSLVGRPDIQRLLGATTDHPGAQLFFFSGSGFSEAAVEEANKRKIALFTFVLDGSMTPVNDTARRVSRPRRPGAHSDSRDWAAVEAKSAAQVDWAFRNWRAIAGVVFLLVPFGSFGDKDVYTGPFLLDALKFLGIFVALWGVGAALIAWQVRDRLVAVSSPTARPARRPPPRLRADSLRGENRSSRGQPVRVTAVRVDKPGRPTGH